MFVNFDVLPSLILYSTFIDFYWVFVFMLAQHDSDQSDASLRSNLLLHKENSGFNDNKSFNIIFSFQLLSFFTTKLDLQIISLFCKNYLSLMYILQENCQKYY